MDQKLFKMEAELSPPVKCRMNSTHVGRSKAGHVLNPSWPRLPTVITSYDLLLRSQRFAFLPPTCESTILLLVYHYALEIQIVWNF
jgi:hypothetical protein